MSIALIKGTHEIVRCSPCEHAARTHALSRSEQLRLHWSVPMPLRRGASASQAHFNCQVCGRPVPGGIRTRVRRGTCQAAGGDPAPSVAWPDRLPQPGTAMTKLWLDAAGKRWSSTPTAWLLAVPRKQCPHCERSVDHPDGVRLIEPSIDEQPAMFGVPQCDGCDGQLGDEDVQLVFIDPRPPRSEAWER